jgi:hypothetical protein
MNMFARTARAFDEKKGQALALLRKASFVASDETFPATRHQRCERVTARANPD